MGQVVLGRRLRDQVYDLIRNDLTRGVFYAHERLYEVDLAAKYRVSRTPVREALFQLVREGLIVSEERGFSLPVDTAKSISDCLEVRLLLDPKVAGHAAANRNPEQVKIMSKAYARSVKADENDHYGAYVDAVHAFRVALREMCDNVPLSRCAMLIEDQFLAARNELFKVPQHRALELVHHNKILSSIEAGNSGAAETAMLNYVLAVRDLLLNSPVDILQSSEKAVRRRPRPRQENSKSHSEI